MANAKETVVESVKMTDGRVVDFPGKRKLQKESFIAADGSITTRIDWRNGETRTFTPREDMIPKYAAHGIGQKLGDEIAGLKDPNGQDASIEDCVMAVDDLIERLNNGEWSERREGSGMGGTSILLRAIVEVSGKTIDKIKAYLKTKTPAEKAALRDSKSYREVVKRLEAERDAKKQRVDDQPLVAEVDAL